MRLRIAPSWPVYWAAMKAQMGLQIAAILLGSFSILISTRNPVYSIVIITFALGLGSLGTWMYFRNSAIEVYDNGAIVKRSWIGSTRTFSVADIGSSLYALQVGVSWVPATHTLLLMRPDGTALLRLRGQYWERSALEAFIGALGITPIFVPQRVTPLDLKVVHPRAISWPEANPVMFAVVVGGAAIVLVILIVVVLFAVLFAQSAQYF